MYIPNRADICFRQTHFIRHLEVEKGDFKILEALLDLPNPAYLPNGRPLKQRLVECGLGQDCGLSYSLAGLWPTQRCKYVGLIRRPKRKIHCGGISLVSTEPETARVKGEKMVEDIGAAARQRIIWQNIAQNIVHCFYIGLPYRQFRGSRAADYSESNDERCME